jgi:hypothetical protein
LRSAAGRHLAVPVDEWSVRRARDDRDIAALAGTTLVSVGPARVNVTAIDAEQLTDAVAEFGPLLQTCVVACTADLWEPRGARLLLSGCTRVCPPGTAHMPGPEWPHDGVGRFAPLLR